MQLKQFRKKHSGFSGIVSLSATIASFLAPNSIICLKKDLVLFALFPELSMVTSFSNAVPGVTKREIEAET